MIVYKPADPPRKAGLYWLELREFPDHPKIAVRFNRLSTDGKRAEIETIGGDQTLFIVEIDRLLEES